MENDKAYFAGGCFWCLEASFRLVPGVLGVISGYSGGTGDNPTYKQISTGSTGYAEAVEVEYDPSKVSYIYLLDIFFQLHDPSTKDRQGNDIGTQYRSVIFYENKEQKSKGEEYLKHLENSGRYPTVLTELVPLTKFWPAEQYHQKYFEKHPDQAYCQATVRPKIEKISKFLQSK